jgi:hypothetical protein
MNMLDFEYEIAGAAFGMAELERFCRLFSER